MRVVLGLGCLAVACTPLGPAPGGHASGMRRVVEEDFRSPAALSGFAFSDPAAWRSSTGNGDTYLELLDAPETWIPPHRAPRHLALLTGARFDDFVLELDMQSTTAPYPHRDLCLVFGFESPARFYYVHLAPEPDANAHNVFRVYDAPREAILPIPEHGVDWGAGWHRVRLERRDGRVSVWFDGGETPLFAAEAPGIGLIGFGSFDDAGRFARMRVYAERVIPAAGDPFH